MKEITEEDYLMSKNFKILLSIISLVIFAFLIIIFSGSKIYTDWLWFENLGFSSTFITMFFTNFYLRIVVGIIFTVFLFLNLYFTKKPLLQYIDVNINKNDNVESLFGGREDNILGWFNKKRLNYLYLLVSIILGFLFSSINQELWKIVLKYFNQTKFGMVDPIFGRDVGYYVFSLPFLNFLREMGMVLIILTLIVVAAIYTLASGISSFNEMKFKLSSRGKTHLTILVVAFLFLKAFGYRLNMYQSLYSGRGVAFGASYTDIHANLLGLRILFYIAIIIGILLFGSLLKRNFKIILWGLGIWLVTSVIFGGIYPGFVQRFQVEPNEMAKEREYINYNIDMTLKAYGLNNIKNTTFTVKDDLTPEVLAQNEETINNIRLWDSRPLGSTYSQLQGLRQYYTFPDVDIDRYYVDGKYTEVMLALREIDQTRLSNQAKTWINQTLKYTHGYGLVMSPVNKITTEGLPYFYIKDIPPKTFVDIDIKNSAIYYGEKTNNYVIVNTKSEEFDYPMGSKNAYTNYQGTGGVNLKNFLRKIIFAIRFNNIKMLLNTDLTSDSKIMYYRNIKERAQRVAPFLSFDRDPYAVLVNGRLFWIQDAYTTTNSFPYSQPISNLGNYIRNSVKIVIDAYNGNMDFYVVDKNDPLAITYQRIFPELFKDGSKMPAEIRKHIRYPVDLFLTQASLYSTYHMTDPTVFYNKEDLWNIANENYAGSSIQVQPYYVIMQLPESNETEFVLMLPFTPVNKNNMIAWMAARSDGKHYGELTIYNFPKDKLVYGPMQIESRIDQDSEISQLLTLWGQRGSRVIRGNLLVIPIDNSILYVEPIYLQAETSELPELKRVIVAYQDKIVMRPTLEQALNNIFGIDKMVDTEVEEDIPAETKEGITGTLEELSKQALDVYNQALKELQDNNWAKYGELINQLKDILEQMNKLP